MKIIKYIILFIILLTTTLIGRLLGKRYIDRLNELEEMKNALNIFKTKIKFTYEPIPEVFNEISKNINDNIGNIFKRAIEKMEENKNANMAWEEAIEESDTNLNIEDKKIIKMLSKMLGQTDVDGQVSQIEITEEFLEKQIQDAIIERQKNEKLYTRLGTIVGLVIVIILC